MATRTVNSDERLTGLGVVFLAREAGKAILFLDTGTGGSFSSLFHWGRILLAGSSGLRRLRILRLRDISTLLFGVVGLHVVLELAFGKLVGPNLQRSNNKNNGENLPCAGHRSSSSTLAQ